MATTTGFGHCENTIQEETYFNDSEGEFVRKGSLVHAGSYCSYTTDINSVTVYLVFDVLLCCFMQVTQMSNANGKKYNFITKTGILKTK